MGTPKLLILENALGQKVRTFSVDSEALNIVYLKNSRRVEAYADLQDLKDQDIEYTLIKKVSVDKVGDKGIALQGIGHLRLLSTDAVSSPSYELPQEEDKEQLQTFLQKSSIGHLVFVIVLVTASWISAKFFSEKTETPLVTIVMPKEEKPVVKKTSRPHVKVSEKKIKKTRKVVKAVKKSKIARPVKTAQKAKSINVQKVGALAALGGIATGTKGYEGLDSRSMKNIRAAGRGNGGGGVGSAGQGGIKGYLPGKSGLIAGSAGSGGKAQSAGGHGTRGVGGGRAGYGKISLVGGTSAVSLPLDDEAEVVGGLDRDQIIAVINKNKGQIIYCYEKGLQAQPNIGGRVAVDFVIGPSGRITKANVAQSSLGSRSVENCMLSKMKTWQFPRPVGNVNVDVLYPFELMRVTSR